MEGFKMRKKKYFHNVGVMLDEETYQQLVLLTDKKEVTVSEFIRALVQEKLAENTEGGRQQC
jgi:hypothetical protein